MGARMSEQPREVTLDFERMQRIGIDEAILCQGKTVEQLTEILSTARSKGARFLLTRLAQSQLEGLSKTDRDSLDYEPVSRTAYFGQPLPTRGEARVAIVSAGTSDAHVTREVERTLRWSGIPTTVIADVGVAGLWRLMNRIEDIRRHAIVVCAAGMDAALPTVLGGLYGGVVIGVPTSTGYGVATGGHTALHSMLSSCSPGILTLNIDNGYGAACAAMRVLRVLDAGRP